MIRPSVVDNNRFSGLLQLVAISPKRANGGRVSEVMPCGENWLAASGSEAVFAAHEDGYGSAVVYLDQHILAEASGLHFESGGLQKLDEFVDKRLRILGCGGIGEAGAASFAGI